MKYSRLAGVGFLVAGIAALFRSVIGPVPTTLDVFTAVMGVGLCSLGFLWLTGRTNIETDTETNRDGRRITLPIAAIAAGTFFIIGVAAYVAI